MYTAFTHIGLLATFDSPRMNQSEVPSGKMFCGNLAQRNNKAKLCKKSTGQETI